MRALGYVAFVQLLFSSLDIFARMSLRQYASLMDAMAAPWFLAWLVGQVAMLPLQIRVIRRNGIGRGVALMNAFSVLFACAGGWLIGHEALPIRDWIAVGLVLLATGLFVSAGVRGARSNGLGGEAAPIPPLPLPLPLLPSPAKQESETL